MVRDVSGLRHLHHGIIWSDVSHLSVRELFTRICHIVVRPSHESFFGSWVLDLVKQGGSRRSERIVWAQ
jgi:hypothetical protein